jgi:hypothetical protein
LDDSTSSNTPLDDYFKPILQPLFEKERSIFEANMYLAEDRILCFALIAAGVYFKWLEPGAVFFWGLSLSSVHQVSMVLVVAMPFMAMVIKMVLIHCSLRILLVIDH